MHVAAGNSYPQKRGFGHDEGRAQEIFIEMVVDQEEREAFRKEVWESAGKHSAEEIEDQKDVWVGLSDIKDSE